MVKSSLATPSFQMLNSQGLKFNFSLKIGSNFSQLADIVKSSSGGWRSVLESIQSDVKPKMLFRNR